MSYHGLRRSSIYLCHQGLSRLSSSKASKFIIASLLFLYGSLCFSQESTPLSKQNGFQAEVLINQLKEENLHPKVHAGIGFGLRYSSFRTKRNENRFEIGAQFSKLKTKYESLAVSLNIQLFSTYAYLFNAVSKSKFTYKIGPELGLQYNLSHYPNWDESHLYWANFLELGVRNSLKYQLKDKQVLTLNVSFPLFSMISRPELVRMYKIDDISVGGILGSMHSNIEGAFWNHSFISKSRLEYRFQISERVMQAICYSFNYSRIQANEGLPLHNLQHLIGFKLYY